MEKKKNWNNQIIFKTCTTPDGVLLFSAQWWSLISNRPSGPALQNYMMHQKLKNIFHNQ
jgi:hypothetical protein